MHVTRNLEDMLRAHRDGDNVDVKVDQSSSHPPVKTIVIHLKPKKNAIQSSLLSHQPHFKPKLESHFDLLEYI